MHIHTHFQAVKLAKYLGFHGREDEQMHRVFADNL